jgi:Mg2+ and Co2+ transporter CorA
MGISTSSDAQFASFVKGVDSDASGGISFNEFLHVIQEIKLAQLFNSAFLHEVGLDAASLRRHHLQRPRLQQRNKLSSLPEGEPSEGSMGSIEYSPDRIRSVYPIRDVERFIYSKKPSWAAVRWIHVEGIDLLLLRRLSVRHRLHPLAVEDALDIDRERPKYEEYDEHASLILQTVHAACDLSMLKTYQRMYRESLYSRVDQPSSIDAMPKKELEERLEQLAPGRVMTVPEQLSVYILPTVVISVQEEVSKSVWALVKARLDTSYSKVRQHGAAFLVYTIVDACVDELSPIAHTLGAKLAMLERLLRLDSRTFDPNHVAATAKQVKGLKLLCKPLNEVVELLRASLAEKARRESSGNGGSDDIARYLRDVQDHLTAVDEDCERHLDTCRSLADACRTARDSQHSDVSYVLALVAALFLPAQFLTGLYGMNFTNMPELEYHYGYFIWWAVVVAIGALIIAYFKFYKKWL